MSRSWTEEQITDCFVALIAFAGNASAACKALKEAGKETPTSPTLTEWSRVRYAEKYERMREQHADTIEKKAVADSREIIALAHQVQREALLRTMDKLENGGDSDPSRTASNAATVADKMTRDMLTMTNRPTSIREERGLDEMLRSLVGMGVLQVPEEPVPALPEPSAGTEA